MKEPSHHKRKPLEITPVKTLRNFWFLTENLILNKHYLLFFNKIFLPQEIKLFLRTLNSFLVPTPQDLTQSGQRQYSVNISVFVAVNAYFLILLSNVWGNN